MKNYKKSPYKITATGICVNGKKEQQCYLYVKSACAFTSIADVFLLFSASGQYCRTVFCSAGRLKQPVKVIRGMLQ